MIRIGYSKVLEYSINFVYPEKIKDLITDKDETTMGSTVCVRCGATLIPHSDCDVCHDVLRFICSSCSMYTDERIHAYCRRNPRIQGNDSIRKLVQIPNSSQIVLNDFPDNDFPDANIQNQLTEEIKYNSINLFTSYWDSMFDSIKLVNTCWKRIFNISNSWK